MLTRGEQFYMREIERRLVETRDHLSSQTFPQLNDTSSWFSFLAQLKLIQGNFNIDISFLATLMAKDYLTSQYGIQNFNAAEKPQGAPGLDIDVIVPDGRRLVAEIKTTTPYKSNDLGAQQKKSFKKDFDKLANANADLKIFFLTDQKTYELMQLTSYRSQLTNVQVVLLPSGNAFIP